jgi:hypothetical protein
MNHGLINKFFYANQALSNQELFEKYPELERLRRYFKEMNRRDKYYAAMKYHAIKLSMLIYPEIVFQQITDVLNLKNHSSVNHYITNYRPLPDHDEFISKNFDRFVDNYIYPLTTTSAEKNVYGAYKQVALSEYKRNYTEPVAEKTETKKRKYTKAFERSKKINRKSNKPRS